MTVQEAIQLMKHRIETASDLVGKGEDGKAFEDMEIAIECMEEVEQYRALGTVEELKEARKLFEKTKIVGAENIIIIRKDGTYEVDGIDILEAIQKQVAKKLEVCKTPNTSFGKTRTYYICPTCGAKMCCDWKFCFECGQRLDWSEEDD